MKIRITARIATIAAMMTPGNTRRRLMLLELAPAVGVLLEVVSEVVVGRSVVGGVVGEFVVVIDSESVVVMVEEVEVGIAVEIEVVGGGDVEPPNVHTSSGPRGI